LLLLLTLTISANIYSIPGCDSVKVAGMLELFRTQGVLRSPHA